MKNLKVGALVVLAIATLLLFVLGDISDNYKWAGILALWLIYVLHKMRKAVESDFAYILSKIEGMHQANQDEIHRLERGVLHRIEASVNEVRRQSL